MDLTALFLPFPYNKILKNTFLTHKPISKSAYIIGPNRLSAIFHLYTT